MYGLVLRGNGWIPLSSASSYNNVTNEVEGTVDPELGNDPLFTWILVIMCDLTPDPVTPSPPPPPPVQQGISLPILLGVLIVVFFGIVGCCVLASASMKSNNRIMAAAAPPPPLEPMYYSRSSNAYGNAYDAGPVPMPRAPPTNPNAQQQQIAPTNSIDRLFARAGETSLLIAASHASSSIGRAGPPSAAMWAPSGSGGSGGSGSFGYGMNFVKKGV